MLIMDSSLLVGDMKSTSFSPTPVPSFSWFDRKLIRSSNSEISKSNCEVGNSMIRKRSFRLVYHKTCPLCKKAVKESTMKAHIGKYHAHYCRKCRVDFGSRRSYLRHEGQVHCSVKVCTLCGYACKMDEYFQRHYSGKRHKTVEHHEKRILNSMLEEFILFKKTSNPDVDDFDIEI